MKPTMSTKKPSRIPSRTLLMTRRHAAKRSQRLRRHVWRSQPPEVTLGAVAATAGGAGGVAAGIMRGLLVRKWDQRKVEMRGWERERRREPAWAWWTR